MAWYKTGTINLTNGSPNVYGNGTLWNDAAILNSGDVLIGPDSKFYEIGSIQSNTQLTLTVGYLGATAATQAYSILPIGLLPSALAQQVKTTLSIANTALSQAVRFDAAQNLTAQQQGTARSNIGALAGADVGLGLLSKSVAGNVDVTLSGLEAAALFYEFTGALTGNINVIVPASARQFFVRNATSGACSLTVKTAAGTGQTVVQGSRVHLECDGTNVIAPTSIDNATKTDGSGNVGIGVTPSPWISNFRALELRTASFGENGGGDCYLASNLYYSGASQWTFKSADYATLYAQETGTHMWYVAASGVAGSAVTMSLGMKLDLAGNLLLGGVSSGTYHMLRKAATSGQQVLGIGPTGGDSHRFYVADTAGASASACAYSVDKINSTGRSINAAGFVSASGNDYAEYMTKADGCGTVLAGQIVGVDADGHLVDKWASAVSFRIKSTAPSYVGGDTWGTEAALGMERPVEPLFEAPAYTGSDKPADLQDGNASWPERDAEVAQYKADQADYNTAVQAALRKFDTVIMPAYQQQLANFEAALEAARQRVDRIAFCGQVPVNVTGATPGQYVLPVQDGEKIAVALVNEADITFEQYRRAVGQVQNILPDGRANVVVKVI